MSLECERAVPVCGGRLTLKTGVGDAFKSVTSMSNSFSGFGIRVSGFESRVTAVVPFCGGRSPNMSEAIDSVLLSRLMTLKPRVERYKSPRALNASAPHPPAGGSRLPKKVCPPKTRNPKPETRNPKPQKQTFLRGEVAEHVRGHRQRTVGPTLLHPPARPPCRCGPNETPVTIKRLYALWNLVTVRSNRFLGSRERAVGLTLVHPPSRPPCRWGPAAI